MRQAETLTVTWSCAVHEHDRPMPSEPLANCVALSAAQVPAQDHNSGVLDRGGQVPHWTLCETESSTNPSRNVAGADLTVLARSYAWQAHLRHGNVAQQLLGLDASQIQGRMKLLDSAHGQ
jgi:hypothetical protein